MEIERIWRLYNPHSVAPEHFTPFCVWVMSRSRATFSRKEHHNAARESLLGMRQTDKCRERVVLMVRTAEEVVLRQSRGDIERRMAFLDRLPGWAQGRCSIVVLVGVRHRSSAETDSRLRPTPF